MNSDEIKLNISNYYSEKISQYGSSHWGVDWNSYESQELRFFQLSKILPLNEGFSIIDYGCGYGALYSWLRSQRYILTEYYGFDVSAEMLSYAKRYYQDDYFPNWCTDLSKYSADYLVASGIFNVKLEYSEKKWLEFILNTLDELHNKSNKGFSFNILSDYSDIDHRKNYLFYANPSFFFDYCKKKFSKNVALLHDYNLYEFSILIRKDG